MGVPPQREPRPPAKWLMALMRVVGHGACSASRSMVFLRIALVVSSLYQEAPPEPEVPLAIQLPAFLKALSYDRALETDEATVLVAVVFDPGDTASTEIRDRVLQVQGQLTRMRVKGKPVVLEPVPYPSGDELRDARVILVAALRPSAVEELSARARASGAVTLATTPGDVDRGLVLGMESRDGKPRFVVNLTAAEASGASFESSFLDLCRVVER